MMRGVAHPGSLQVPETGPRRGTTPRESAPATRCERSPPALPQPVALSPFAREDASRPRTRADGWKRGFRSRMKPAVAGLPRTSGPGRPKCPRRSPVASVAFQFTEQHGQRGLRGPAAGWLGSRRQCGRQPTLPHRIGKHGVRQNGTPHRSRRADFGYDAVPVRDENGLAAGRQPHVFAELAVQHLDSDGSHEHNVATYSYLHQCKHWLLPSIVGPLRSSRLGHSFCGARSTRTSWRWTPSRCRRDVPAESTRLPRLF